MIQIKGKLKYYNIGTGTWGLISEDGTKYELLKSAFTESFKDDIEVIVEGIIRNDVMSLAMIGKILEVKSFSFI